MRKGFVYLLAAMLGAGLSACAQDKTNDAGMTGKRILVAFFSRAGENYDVGYIEKGNTRIVAEFISEQTGGDLFLIETETPYPDTYKDCTETARREKENNFRPSLKGDVPVEDYDVVFIGYPVWWGDMPMAVYAFIEKHDWKGKTVIPFCTHEGSGISGTDRNIGKACGGAVLLNGVAVKGSVAQKSPYRMRQDVAGWLEELGM